jgi:hypothetical protein
MRSKVTAVSYLHSGVNDTAVFSIDIPFKGSQSHSDMRSKVTAGLKNDTSVHVTGVSMQCQWLCCACYSGFNDTAVPCALCSQIIIPRKNFRQSWFHSSVIDTAVICTAVSITPLWHAQWSHWQRCDMHSSVIDTAVTFTAVDTAVQPTFLIFSANTKPYSKRL